VDGERFAAVLAEVEGPLFRGEFGVRGDPLFERRQEREGLDRGARLPPPLGRQVEGRLFEVRPADHRLDPAGVIVDDDDRGGGGGVAEIGADRFFGRFL
jgi:hypothetical protein